MISLLLLLILKYTLYYLYRKKIENPLSRELIKAIFCTVGRPVNIIDYNAIKLTKAKGTGKDEEL